MTTKVWHRLKKFLIWGVIIWYCRSCVMYTDMTHLKDNDLIWYNSGLASSGKTFYSNNGNKSALTIIGRYKANSGNPFRISWGYIESDYEAYVKYRYRIDQSYDDKMLDGGCIFSRMIGYDSLMVKSNLGNFSTKKDIADKSGIEGYVPVTISEFTLDSTILRDCMIFNQSNSEYPLNDTSTNNKITEYVISRQFGLVYYRFEDGTEYHRRFR